MIRESFLTGSIALMSIIIVVIWPGFTAGMIVGAWHSLPGIVPALAGFLITLVALCCCLVVAFFRHFASFQKQVFQKYVLFLFLIPVIGFSELASKTSAISLEQFSALTVAIVVGFLIVLIGSNTSLIKSFVWGFVIGSLIYGLGELLRVLRGGEIHAMESAFGANPIFAAHFLGLSVLGLVAFNRYGLTLKRYAIVGCAFLIVCLIATGSWGPTIGLSIALLYFFISSKEARTGKKKSWGPSIVIWSILLGGPAILIFREALRNFFYSPDAQSRMYTWSLVLSWIRSNPVLGVGVETVRGMRHPLVSYQEISPHNIFIELWASYGIVPFFFMVFILATIFKSLAPIGQASLIFIIISFSVSGSLSVSINFWVGIALSIVFGSIKDNVSFNSFIGRETRVVTSAETKTD